MKAVIMEVKNGYAAVLTQDGRFIKIQDNHYQVGEEVVLETVRKKSFFSFDLGFFRRALVPCLAAASFLLVVISVNDFLTPYSVISFDVNPSIEVIANRYDLVLDIEAVDEDAQEIVNEIKSSGSQFKKVETITETILDDFSNGNYEAEDGTTYMVVSTNSKKEEHSEKLMDQIETIQEDYKNISSTSVIADDDLVTKANEEGTTAGKLYLVDCLKEAQNEESFDEEEWIRKPVKDIVKEIRTIQDKDREADEEVNSEKKEDVPEEIDISAEKPESVQDDNPDENTVPTDNPEIKDKKEDGVPEESFNNEEPLKEESFEDPPEKPEDVPVPDKNSQESERME